MIVWLLQLSTAFCLGLFVGSMLTEGMILVPYWRSMEPKTFLDLHGTMGPRLYGYFAPLTILATLIPTVTAGACLGSPTHPWVDSTVASAIMLLILGIYFLYFKAANESFATGSVGIEGLPAELRRWAAWHWLRTVLAAVAFLASLRALDVSA